MRYYLLISCSVLSVVALGRPTPAHAQAAVVCVNCSDLIGQAAEITNLVAQLADMATNLERLSGGSWSNVIGQTQQLDGLLQQGQLISGQLNTLMSRLDGGVNSGQYATQFPQYNTMVQEVAQWQRQLSQNLANTQQTLTQQTTLNNSDSSQVANLQTRAAATFGEQSALNVQNEMQGQVAAQLTKMQSTLIQLAQLTASEMAVRSDRQAASDSEAAAILADPALVSNTDGAQY